MASVCQSMEKLPGDPSSKNGIRHVERRRTATCSFANRVARLSVDHYREMVPKEHCSETACIATILAHSIADGSLSVLSMGVGTKFLRDAILRDETDSERYGTRLRDCHAEVLARRAFNRFLLMEITARLQGGSLSETDCILDRHVNDEGTDFFCLKPGISLHMYTSSTPCGNSSLKKFGKLYKEVFRQDLGPDEWPKEKHEPVNLSSLHLGQGALLVKKDTTAKAWHPDDSPSLHNITDVAKQSPSRDRKHSSQIDHTNKKIKKTKPAPAEMSDDWAPPGTTIVALNKGTIHSCSDKISRWNYLGLQGSLLMKYLEKPMYMSTLTVGRKLSANMCRRAVCCRLDGSKGLQLPFSPIYELNHPAVMGTSIYLSEDGVVQSNTEVSGQDVRFHSSLAWASWKSVILDSTKFTLECINGDTGFLGQSDIVGSNVEIQPKSTSCLSTEAMVHAFQEVAAKTMTLLPKDHSHLSLSSLHDLKERVSPRHETMKTRILTEHRVLKGWKRRKKTETVFSTPYSRVGR